MGNTCVAYALVRNLFSYDSELQFRNFRLWKTDTPGLVRDAVAVLPMGSRVQLHNDWIYERHYTDVPENFGSVPFDVQDVLLLLRLFRIGEISFVRHSIKADNGTILQQFPQRTMTEKYSPQSNWYVFHKDDCAVFDHFADEIRQTPAWRSAWFETATRYFLFGSAKEFELEFGVVDRVIDYTIAMEASLVPEVDFVDRRLRERAVKLINAPDEVKQLLKRLYGVRSTVVHGSRLVKEQNRFLQERMNDFEQWVRAILTAAVRQLSPDEKIRSQQLKNLYDVSDAIRLDRLRQLAAETKNKELVAIILKATRVG